MGLLGCSGSAPAPTQILYRPPVVFDGIINGQSVHLPGTLAYPNICTLTFDTIQMDFYSADYSVSPGAASTGIHVKFHVYPKPSDSLATQLTTHRVMAHVAIHGDQGTCSYQVVPDDSLSATRSVYATIVHFQAIHGATIELREVTMDSDVLGALCGRVLEIRDGTIAGTIP